MMLSSYCVMMLVSEIYKRSRRTRDTEVIVVSPLGPQCCGWDSFLYISPRWPSGKASVSRVEGLGFESRLRRDFFGVESYQ